MAKYWAYCWFILSESDSKHWSENCSAVVYMMEILVLTAVTRLHGVISQKIALIVNSVALVHERTIPTERPLLVGEVSANFCGWRGVRWSVRQIPYGRNLGFLDRIPFENDFLLFCTAVCPSYLFMTQMRLFLANVSSPHSNRNHFTFKCMQQRCRSSCTCALHHEDWCTRDPHLLDLGTSWTWVVSFTLQPLYPWYPLDKRMGKPQTWTGEYGKIKILEPSGTWTQTAGHPTRSQSLTNCTAVAVLKKLGTYFPDTCPLLSFPW
jgi:hypothetical protein